MEQCAEILSRKCARTQKPHFFARSSNSNCMNLTVKPDFQRTDRKIPLQNRKPQSILHFDKLNKPTQFGNADVDPLSIPLQRFQKGVKINCASDRSRQIGEIKTVLGKVLFDFD